MKKFRYLILFILLSNQVSAQLDPMYKQYQFNQLMVNPAYAGIYNRFSTSFISTLQWAGMEGAPKTNTVTMNSSMKEGEMGIGAMVINDRLGVSNNTEGQIMASYNLRFRESKLGMGIQGGLINYTYDMSKLELDYVDDPRLLTGLENSVQPNFGFGFMYMNPKYYVGFSIPRMLNSTTSDGVFNSTRYHRHFYVSGGYVFDLSMNSFLKFNGMMTMVEGRTPSYDISASVILEGSVWSGVTIRDLRYFGVFVIFEIGNNVRVGYSFELPSNSLIQSSYGTHEVSISFDGVLGGKQILRNKFF